MSGISGIVGFASRLPALSASINTHTVFQLSGVETETVTTTPSGGIAPYTYAWTEIAGVGVTATAPTSASTAFNGYSTSATYRCTVTDAAHQTAYDDVVVTFYTI